MTLEADVQQSILDYLETMHIYAWRNQSQGTYDASIKTYRINKKFKKGVSDILGILKDGRLLAIEVKRTGIKKGSPEQHKFIDDINERGGLAFIADDLQTVVDKLKDLL